jgi:hypothetical protein
MTKVSLSWLDLKPNQDNYGNQEDYADYLERIRKTFSEFDHIPDEVVEQWLWAHHGNYETLRNYAWIDYKNAEFVLCQLTNEQLMEINVIEEYSGYVKNRARSTDIKDFCCTEDDLNNWINNGTWRTPPIILDVSTIKEKIPIWSEIIPPYQLIEGHSRLGYLKSMINLEKNGKIKVAPNHYVYIMKMKENQQEEISEKLQCRISDIEISLTDEEFRKISDELDKEL